MHIRHTSMRVVSPSSARKWGASIAMVGLLIMSLAAKAQADDASVAEKRPLNASARAEVLGEVFAGLHTLAGNQTRLVMYHQPGNTPLGGAVSVLVNGAHHTALVQGDYSQLCMPTGEDQAMVRLRRADGRSTQAVEPAMALKMQGGQTQFLRVQTQDGQIGLKLVDPVQALQELKGLRVQMHTVSRVKNSAACDVKMEAFAEPAASVLVPAVADAASKSSATELVPSPVVKNEQILLSQDALFAFGKADLQHLIMDGQTTLQELVKRIQRDYKDVEQILVMGHADPLGTEAFNERLSRERAHTVREYLRKQLALPSERVQAEGRGAREPKVQCPKTLDPQAIACHQTNRRVTIHITGLSH